METTALVVAEAGASPTLQTIRLGEPLDDEVLLEIVASGVCHTDHALAAGRLPGPFPAIMGHEGAGKVMSRFGMTMLKVQVLRTGSKVTNVKVGDSVLCSFAFCGSCASCDRQKPTSCDSA